MGTQLLKIPVEEFKRALLESNLFEDLSKMDNPLCENFLIKDLYQLKGNSNISILCWGTGNLTYYNWCYKNNDKLCYISFDELLSYLDKVTAKKLIFHLDLFTI